MSPNADMTGLAAGDRRQRVRAWIEQPRVQNLVIVLILLNAALLGLETSAGAMAAAGGLIVGIDRAILAVFVVEITLRLYAHRAAFWRDPWSVFDFAVVAIALVPATGPLSVLRALRVLRVLRLLTMVPSMRRVVAGLLSAIPGLSSVVAIIAILFYVGAVIATKLFGAAFPEWFGTLGESAYTLFQVMTLESWSMGIARPVMAQFPHAWAFFVPFIMISTFTMLNLFIAVIVNAIQSTQHAEAKHTEEVIGTRIDADTHELQSELRALRIELAEMRKRLDGDAAARSRG